jgi:glycine oxidase
MFPALTQDLLEITRIDNGYRVCGGIEFFWESDAPQVAAWKHEGIHFEPLAKGEIERLEPACVSLEGQGYYFKSMAQLRNPWHLRALIAACQSRGVRLRPQTALEKIEIHGNTVAGVRLNSGEKRVAGRYLLAAGAWTNPVLAGFGQNPGIHPVRGQIVLLRTPEPLINRVILIGKKYVVPREDGRLLIGATEEPEAGFVKKTTATGVIDLLDFGCAMIPKLRNAEVEKCWAGLRPGSPDGMPFLGAIPGFDNAFVAAGHFRAGIQLSPGSAKVTAEVILGQKPTIPLGSFRLYRKPDMLTVPAFRA